MCANKTLFLSLFLSCGQRWHGERARSAPAPQAARTAQQPALGVPRGRAGPVIRRLGLFGPLAVALTWCFPALAVSATPTVPTAAPSALSSTVPTAAATARGAGATAEPSFASEEERSRFLSQIAEKIAVLRQQQALVEAQVALAKARADLATAGSGGAGAAQSGNAISNSGVLKKPGGGRPNYGALELLGIQGTPKRRWANVAVSGGAVQQVEAGSVVAGWRVLEVRLGEVLLEPVGQAGEPTLLRVEGSVERAPDGPAASARQAAQSARKAAH